MQIGNLDDHYHFRLNITLISEGHPSANSKSLDQFSEIGLRGEISEALLNFPKVNKVESMPVL